MILEIVFAVLLFAFSTMILLKTRNLKNPFITNEADRCLTKRCKVTDSNPTDFEGRFHTCGTALLRNKKTGEYKFINQAKLYNVHEV